MFMHAEFSFCEQVSTKFVKFTNVNASEMIIAVDHQIVHAVNIISPYTLQKICKNCMTQKYLFSPKGKILNS